VDYFFLLFGFLVVGFKAAAGLVSVAAIAA
jgi:hypothetical protein